MENKYIILFLTIIIGFLMVTLPYLNNDLKATTDHEAKLHSVDSDNDYVPDYIEIKLGMDPYNDDSDSDLLSDIDELYLGTDPVYWDTDNDKMADGHEKGAQAGSTSPFEDDTDHDGLPDPWEDNDGDGLLNREEQLPMHDGLCFFTDPFHDPPEERPATDPNDPDTDGDSWSDGEELQVNITYSGPGAVNPTPPRDRANPELDIANTGSYAYWFCLNVAGWDAATFADWRDGLKKAGSYLIQIPYQCTHIAWYHFSPYYVWEQQRSLGIIPSSYNFTDWKQDFFHSAQNATLRSDWDRNAPYKWNWYDCDPTLNDTDGDIMDDNWDNLPLRYNIRNGTFTAINSIRRVGPHPWIPSTQPYEDVYWSNATTEFKWNFFGTNISVLELEKGDWIDINISIGLEKCNITHPNFINSRWDPIAVAIQFRRVDLGDDNLPHTDDDELNETNVARITQRFTNVDADHIVMEMREVNFTNHLELNTTLTFYYQRFRLRVPSRVPAGQIAIIVETDCEDNFYYFPSDEYPAY